MERGGGVISRVGIVVVVLAAAGAGLLFAPVFGIAPLAPPLLVVALTTYVVAELAGRWPALAPWRAALALLVGLLALAETLLVPTTVGGLPTGETVRALAAGVTESWQLTLQSTWPARSDPELLLFVPLAVLVAAVLGVELRLRLRWPLVSLLPALAVLVLSQAYVALTGVGALAAGLGFALLAGVLLISARREDLPAASAAVRPSRRAVIAAALVVPTLVLAVGGSVLATAADPVRRPAYSLRDERPVPLPPEHVMSPLDEVDDRLSDPRESVFSYTTDHSVDRWRLVVLERFDGVSWTPGGQYLRMGAALAEPPAVTVPTSRFHATVRVPDLESPWVPSQIMPAEVSGVAPLVDEDSGTLRVTDRDGPVSYHISWWEPEIDPVDLAGAAIDRDALAGNSDLGVIPPGIAELAEDAVAGQRPSFQAAMVLEQFMSERYELANGAELPTGNGWVQLRRFLLESKQGTSEQFAAAYVVLARITGIPARVAVGFRAPERAGTDVVVRNEDVLAWPEVAVEGVGWVPLDPSGTAAGSGEPPEGLARTTAEARAQLPPREELEEREPPPDEEQGAGAGTGGGVVFPVVPVLVGVAVVIVALLAGVPLAAAVRRWRRRRRRGAAAVVGAWHEARDRLRAYGVPFTSGMTVRDLAGAVPDPPVVAGLHTLAHSVDVALWSGTGPAPSTVDEAWSAVRAVRRGLRARPFGRRLRAALNVRALRPPR